MEGLFKPRKLMLARTKFKLARFDLNSYCYHKLYSTNFCLKSENSLNEFGESPFALLIEKS